VHTPEPQQPLDLREVIVADQAQLALFCGPLDLVEQSRRVREISSVRL
jgi:hypothetical protein